MGHISKSRSAFSGWVYRLRRLWFTILDELNGHYLFLSFFRWYAPYFFAYSFVLARSDEYVADKCGAEIAGSQAMAESLIAIHVYGKYLEEKFWPDIIKHADDAPVPDVDPFTMMFKPGEFEPSDGDKMNWLLECWKERTDTSDTHPCLSERLSALGFRGVAAGPIDAAKPPLPPPASVGETAAKRFMAGWGDRLISLIDSEWRRTIYPVWTNHHGEAKQGRMKLDTYERKIEFTQLTAEEMLDRAKLTARFYGAGYAVPLMMEMVKIYPLDLRSYLYTGSLLLELNDAGGINYLERAAQMNPHVGAKAYRLIAEYLRSQGQYTKAMHYERSADQFSRYTNTTR